MKCSPRSRGCGERAAGDTPLPQRDRELDPAETTNRHNDPAYADVRDALRAQTHALMERLEDRGIPYADLLEMVTRPEALADLRLPPNRRPAGWEARPKGRPVHRLGVLGPTATP